MEFSFKKEVDGIEYHCIREVTGSNIFYQTVRVKGIEDEEKDGVAYDHSNKVAMESVANIIAVNIIRRALKNSSK